MYFCFDSKRSFNSHFNDIFCKPPHLFMAAFTQPYLCRDTIHRKVPPQRMGLARVQSRDQNPRLPPPVGSDLPSNPAKDLGELKPQVRLIGEKTQSCTESEEVVGPKSQQNLMRAVKKIPVQKRSGRTLNTVQGTARSLPGVRRIFHRRNR